ncbi:MAG: helicase-associated domain-containing protein, partial [Candidatus Contendobacter sp.]|nr:helicase-associated domain-containing protein [Candidatus Contendobacter sp.]
WGADDLPFFSRYDGLLYLRVNPLGAYALGLADRYQPTAPEIAATPLLRVLPNLEIAAIGARLEPADAMLLDSYAEKVSDAVWKLEQGRLLEALEAGHDITVLAELLVSLGGQPLPETVERFLEDMARRVRSLKAIGTARLIECADAALATLIANDSRTKPYCLLAGDRYLAVPAESETRFRSALRKLGYGLLK